MKTLALLATLSGCFYGKTPGTAARAARIDAAEAAVGAVLVYSGRQQLASADAPNTSGSYADSHTANGSWLETGGVAIVTAALTGLAINELVQLGGGNVHMR